MTIDLRPRIVVFGVGGAGGNAVDNMIERQLQGVEFVVANTDSQALERSKAATRIQLGPETTQGLGAGARPELGAEAAEESKTQIEAALEGAHMVFIAAGMGGGTGTGAAPVIARMARDKGILTVGVVTKPFGFEHHHRMKLAEVGVEDIRQYVDTLIVVPNQNLFRIANERTPFSEAFQMVDDVLYSGVRGITDLMVMPGLINLDFADVKAVMAGMGTAMMGIGEAEGEGRALQAARAAVDNPLLDDVSIKGAQAVLINITGGNDITLFELDEAANEVRSQVATDANVILGSAFDDTLNGKLRISVVAAGLQVGDQPAARPKPAVPSQPDPAAASDFVAPVVVNRYAQAEETPEPAPMAENAPETEVDARPDFGGRELPAAHIDGEQGEDHVSADAVFGAGMTPAQDRPVEAPAAQPAPEAAPETPQAKPEEHQAGFAGLFGWRRNHHADAKSNDDEAPVETAEAPAAQTPEPAPFDDADLEIPAFLRRSANH